jgi:LmbE family N-acetylglucosaminyl deacetylase
LTRLLVISPHPDDEAIAAAGVMQRVRSAGGRVRVVLLTSGDAFPPALEHAALEARRALKTSGDSDAFARTNRAEPCSRWACNETM